MSDPYNRAPVAGRVPSSSTWPARSSMNPTPWASKPVRGSRAKP